MVKSKRKKSDKASKEVFLPWLIERREKIFFVFFAVFMILLLISQGGANDLKRAPIWAFRGVAFLGFLFFYLLEYARPEKNGIMFPTSRQKILYSLYCFIIIFLAVNLLTATSWQNAFSESLTFLMILAFMSLASFYAFSRERIKYVIHILLAIGLFAAVHGLITYFMRGASSPLDSFFAWHNPAGGYFVPILVVFLTLLLTESPMKSLGRYGWIGTVIIGAGLVFTLSRGAWIAALLAALLLLILLGLKKAYNRTGVKTASIVLVVILLAAVFIGGKSFFEPVFLRIVSFTAAEDFSMQGRENFYSGAVEIFKDNKLTGIGLGAFGYVYPQYQKDPRFYARDPHSFYLRLLSEGGLFGIIIILHILWCYFHVLKKFFRCRDSSIIPISAGLIAALTAGLLHLAIDFDDTFPIILLNLGVIWILALNLLDPVVAISKEEEESEESKPKIRTSIAGASITLALFVFIAVFHCGRMYYSESFVDAGKTFSSVGEYKQAEDLYSTALSYYPLNERALSERVKSLLFMHDIAVQSDSPEEKPELILQKAEASSKNLKKYIPFSARSYHLSGLTLIRDSNRNSRITAIDDFAKALELDSMNSPRYFRDAAQAYLEMGGIDPFRSTIRKFTRRYPYNLVEEYSKTRLDWIILPDIYQDILMLEASLLESEEKLTGAKARYKKVLKLEEIRKRILGDDYIERKEIVEIALSKT
ncbi:O-antigen ligase family protein [bacterium]|nr:O-antigen ligase family protein [bacterium]